MTSNSNYRTKKIKKYYKRVKKQTLCQHSKNPKKQEIKEDTYHDKYLFSDRQIN